MHVKKNDKVVILTGKDRMLTGEIIAVDRAKSRVKVARRNMIVKHRKPNPITGESGARIDTENWIHASNVSLYSTVGEDDDQRIVPVRTNARWKGFGGEVFETREAAEASFGDKPSRVQKVRFAKKTGEVFD
jgi:large subunit ribosomal protein L24